MKKYLCYVSKQAHTLSDADLENLLQSCRENNEADSITGMLIYYKGIFVQFLEGPDMKIDRLFDKITNDTRHHSVIELASGTLEERQFSNWTMAFKKLEDSAVEKITGHTDFNKNQLFLTSEKKENHPALVLLNSFVNSL